MVGKLIAQRGQLLSLSPCLPKKIMLTEKSNKSTVKLILKGQINHQLKKNNDVAFKWLSLSLKGEINRITESDLQLEREVLVSVIHIFGLLYIENSHTVQAFPFFYYYRRRWKLFPSQIWGKRMRTDNARNLFKFCTEWVQVWQVTIVWQVGHLLSL